MDAAFDEQELDEPGEDEPVLASPDAWFFPTPVLKLLLFGLIGGVWYCAYWQYRNWRAYRAAWGYSREPFWSAVHAATGYRPSPLWRALLGVWYCFALFPAVERECRAHAVSGMGAPFLLAVAFWLSSTASMMVHAFSLEHFVLQPLWAMLVVQVAINRLNRSRGHGPSWQMTGMELVFVGLGALTWWGAL